MTKLIKLNADGQPEGILRTELTEDLKLQGWKYLEEEVPPLNEDPDQECIAQYEVVDEDTVRMTYRLGMLPDCARRNIEQWKKELAETDYIVTKLSEYNLVMQMGVPDDEKARLMADIDGYDIAEICRQREILRNKIRKAEKDVTV